jgi:hydrogenase nickel incorporation protein HypB
LTDPTAVHEHPHALHEQLHASPDHLAPTHGTTITLEQRVLAKNDQTAERNRDWLAARGLLSLNLTSSPGSGKTTLLERTVRELGPEIPISVVEGDQETLLDAEQLRATGCKVIQINTGSGCHLDAHRVDAALQALDPPERGIVFISRMSAIWCYPHCSTWAKASG